MAPEDQPDDIHSECRAEIERLEQQLAALRKPCVHHRKLAEKIDVAITAAFLEQNQDLTEVVLAVLAAEGVANPAKVYDLQQQLATLRRGQA